VISAKRPERSAIILAGGDGALTMSDIAALDLGGRLVVLAACQSADGGVLDGEGVQSLGRAFFLAGARTVVASLWPLRDDDAVALFASFYRHLDGGASVADALASAKRERLASGAPAAAWAGVVVLGDGDLRLEARASDDAYGGENTGSVRNRYLAAGLVGGLVLLLGAGILRMRRDLP
jgi:CHAT domain-containing protein